MSAGIKDLKPDVFGVLADKDWHAFAEILSKSGDKIMPERACRIYAGTGAGARIGAENRPVDERVRMGRRRAVYQCLQLFLHTDVVECQNPAADPDLRVYRAKKDWKPEDSKPKPPQNGKRKPVVVGPVAEKISVQKPKKRLPMPTVSPSSRSLVSKVHALDDLFSQKFPKSGDWRDVAFHCRALLRIIACNDALANSTKDTVVLPAVKEVRVTNDE